MNKIKKIILVALILPFAASANPLAIDFFSGIMGVGVKAANEKVIQKKKLENLKAITTSYTSCVTMNKVKKLNFEKQARRILPSLVTIDQRIKYFKVYAGAQRGFYSNLVQCSIFAEEALGI